MCMHKVKKYLAIDLGASSGRGIVGSFDGEKLSLYRVRSAAKFTIYIIV